jgi:hypothetical protein
MGRMQAASRRDKLQGGLVQLPYAIMDESWAGSGCHLTCGWMAGRHCSEGLPSVNPRQRLVVVQKVAPDTCRKKEG